jgi:hypothetical protein
MLYYSLVVKEIRKGMMNMMKKYIAILVALQAVMVFYPQPAVASYEGRVNTLTALALATNVAAIRTQAAAAPAPVYNAYGYNGYGNGDYAGYGQSGHYPGNYPSYYPTTTVSTTTCRCVTTTYNNDRYPYHYPYQVPVVTTPPFNPNYPIYPGYTNNPNFSQRYNQYNYYEWLGYNSPYLQNSGPYGGTTYNTRYDNRVNVRNVQHVDNRTTVPTRANTNLSWTPEQTSYGSATRTQTNLEWQENAPTSSRSQTNLDW